MRPTRSLLALYLTILSTVAACGWPSYWVEADQRLEIAQESVQTVVCETHNGAIAVTGDATSQSVQVGVEKKAGGADQADADAAMAALEVFHEQRGDELHLGWRWNQTKHANWGAVVNFTITCPQQVTVNLESHNGRITVIETGAGVRAVTHNGRIRIEGAAGKAYARTHNGHVGVAGEVEDVTVLSHNGGVSVATTAATVRGSIRTHNGTVVVDLNEAANTRLSCTTHNGSISTDLALSRISMGRSHLVGNIGDGGEELRVETHNGSIRVR